MAYGSGGCRVAPARRQPTPGLISSSPGTAGLPPSISFSMALAMPQPRSALQISCNSSSRRQGATMNDSRNPHVGIEALLTPQNCVLLLIDHQPFQFANLHSHEPTLIVNNVVGLAKTAKVFQVPTILTTVLEERGWLLIKDVQHVFPDQKPINRSFINTWEDKRVVEAVKKTRRQKIVIASLWTEMCLAMPAIQAQGEGYDVYAVTDASGGVSVEAHDMAIRRMVQAGVTPVTWLALPGEWQREWATTKTWGAPAELFVQHGGATGIAFAWEVQLLGSAAKAALTNRH